jgi:hypothetical protein
MFLFSDRNSEQTANGAVRLDLVIENVRPGQDIGFRTTKQPRLMDQAAAFIQSSVPMSQFACTMDATGVVRARQARRCAVVDDVPAGMPNKGRYRALEKDEPIVEVKK